jgi:MFS family permease
MAAAANVRTGEQQDGIPGVTMRGMGLALGIVVISLANFMSVLDTTIVNVAVPHIAGSLAVSPNEGTWVITSYAVAEAITVPLAGWLAARFGVVRVFIVAVICFGLFSALCGFANSLGMLVVFRVLQGLAGGPLMPMSQTLLLRIAPPSLANMAMGLWMMTTILAPIAGPVLGGVISDTAGWPWAFYINVPVSAICAGLAWQLFRSRETTIVKNPVDFVGLGFLIVWVAALQIMLDNGQNEDWFGSSFIVGLAIVALLGFISFVTWELTAEHPIVDLRVFRHRGFAVSAVALSLTFGSFFFVRRPDPALAANEYGIYRDMGRICDGVSGRSRRRHGADGGDADNARGCARFNVVRPCRLVLYHIRADGLRIQHDLQPADPAANGDGVRHAAVLRAADDRSHGVRQSGRDSVGRRPHQLSAHHVGRLCHGGCDLGVEYRGNDQPVGSRQCSPSA